MKINELLGNLGLRDPIWETLGTIIGLLALIISTVVAYDIYYKSAEISETDLTISKRYSHRPFRPDDTIKDRVTVLIDGVKVNSLHVFHYLIENTGQNPIRPGDFIEPIQVSIEEPWQLLFIETGNSVPPDLQVTWTKLTTNTFEMRPMLLNSQDTVETLLYVSHPDRDQEAPSLHWTGRIVDVRSFTTQYPEMSRRTFPLVADSLDFAIQHSGLSTYLFVGVAVLLFIGGTSLGIRGGRIVPCPASQVRLLAALAALSFLVSEVIVGLFIEGTEAYWWLRMRSWTSRNWRSPAYSLIVSYYVVLLIYLAWPTIRSLIRRLMQPASSDK